MKTQTFDAWNPGLNSEIPESLMPMVTLFRPENSTVAYPDAKEAALSCGRKPYEMAAFTASRLATHELLIRVTSDLNVPDGPTYAELGVNLRAMAARILDGYIRPHMAELEAEFDGLRQQIKSRLDEILEQDVYAHGKVKAPTENMGRVIPRGKRREPAELTEHPEIHALAQWKAVMQTSEDLFERACLRGMQAIVGGMVGQRGRLFADKELVLTLASNWVANDYGSHRLGELIQPMIEEAVKAEGYRALPYQKEPFFMNVKGAPGAGKSTLRPLMRDLAERLDVPWEDFALVSPDYWRKFLLDYEGTGEHFKYAASFTGHELQIVDRKLDYYMKEKAMRMEMPHLLIDRFRFDSFMPAPYQRPGGTLLSRFGDTVFLFFMITSPEQTVQRAWQRGLKTGRYKAVDDILHFNIEASIGMQQLLLAWSKKSDQKVHIEFLDNNVPEGERPRTVAFGWNGQLTILDGECLRSLDLFKTIDIDARDPEDLYPDDDFPRQGDFLADCIAGIPNVTFADQKTLRILGQTYDGKCVFQEGRFFEEAGLGNACRDLALRRKGKRSGEADRQGHIAIDFELEMKFTVGQWGGRIAT